MTTAMQETAGNNDMRTVLAVPNDRSAAEIRSSLGEERGFEGVATFESLPGVERIDAARQEAGSDARPEMDPAAGRVAGFVSLKPGSGASTLAAQVAFALQRQGGLNVLLIDLNVATGTASWWGDGSVDHPDVLLALKRLPEFETGAGWRRWTIGRNGVRILPAPFLPAAEGLGPWSAEVLRLIGLARRFFDWVIVDLPPAAEAGTAALAAGFDRVAAVATPDLLSLNLAARRLRELFGEGVQEAALRVVLNRTQFCDLIPLEKVEELFGCRLAATIPDDYLALAASAADGACRRSGRLAEAIGQLAEQMTASGPAEPAAAFLPRSIMAAAPALAVAG